MEDEAIAQLKTTAKLPNIKKIVGLPDLHPGKTPVGAVVLSDGLIFPQLIGNDIGCGMSLFQTSARLKKIKLDRLASIFDSLESLRDIELDDHPYPDESNVSQLGTLGGGNHFLELQAVEKVYLPEEFKRLDLDKDKIFILVHSGSRNGGQLFYESFMSRFSGIAMGTDLARSYLTSQNDLIVWAKRNREMCALKISQFLDSRGELKRVLDSPHNFVEEGDGGLYHRKGAVSALHGPVVIPGSRGTLSFLFKPASDTTKSLFSLAHGAGRKWKRSECKGRLREKYHRGEIYKTSLKSHVICHDKDLLYEEAPEAYKKISDVIDALLSANLGEIVCAFRPLATLKI
jgi:release factor H-coupled RctB family protein